jgi:tryptophan synthase beta chain
MSPLVSNLYHNKVIEARALKQNPCFQAAIQFAKCEGIIPAPESSHAVCAAIEVAEECRENKEPKNIVFNLSGHGHFDMSAYQAYLSGHLQDVEHQYEEGT